MGLVLVIISANLIELGGLVTVYGGEKFFFFMVKEMMRELIKIDMAMSISLN